MKAIVYRRYGSPDVLTYEDADKPKPAANEVLLSVRATSVNPYDWHLMRGEPYFLRLMSGLRAPAVTRLGVDAAGRVEAVGAGVTVFKPGDEVFGACRGALAEYACGPAEKIVIKPTGVTWEQAASVPIAALTALQALRDSGRVAAGHDVLINGASGGVGTFGVQIAKVLGARVTGVCSTGHVSMVQSLGAERVIDYTRDDFTRDSPRYDVIVDCVGNHPLLNCKRVLKPDGRYVAVGGPSGRWMFGALAGVLAATALSTVSRQKLVAMVAKANPQDLTFVGELIAAGSVKPVIDRRYPLPEAAEAIRYLEGGHARGKVIVTIRP
jgi:NADPH:quinone reductase-like Zn-dependent oxidoreductase